MESKEARDLGVCKHRNASDYVEINGSSKKVTTKVFGSIWKEVERNIEANSRR